MDTTHISAAEALDRLRQGNRRFVDDHSHSRAVDVTLKAIQRLLDKAIRANVRNSVSHLRYGSRVLEERVLEGLLQIVGAEYDLESGRVDFFEAAS